MVEGLGALGFRVQEGLGLRVEGFSGFGFGVSSLGPDL